MRTQADLARPFGQAGADSPVSRALVRGALVVFRKSLEKFLREHDLEDRVAEEFEAVGWFGAQVLLMRDRWIA